MPASVVSPVPVDNSEGDHLGLLDGTPEDQDEILTLRSDTDDLSLLEDQDKDSQDR